MGLLLAGGAMGVIGRITALPSERGDAWLVADVVFIAGWLALAALMVSSLIRARRAIAANRTDLG